MNRRIGFYIIFPLLSIVVAVPLFFSINGKNNKGLERTKVSVILEDMNKERWKIMQLGLDAAAKESGTDITVILLDDTMPESQKVDIISREIDNGAEGIIMNSANGAKLLEYLDLISNKIPVAFVGTQIGSENVHACIEADNYRLGKEIAESILEDKEVSIEHISIGIIKGKITTLAGEERLRGFQDAADSNGKLEIKWIVDESPVFTESKIESNLRDNPVDCVVTLDNWSTDYVTKYILNQESQVSLYGMGITEQDYYYLDKGIIDKLFVVDEFVMGYKSLNMIMNRISKQEDMGSIEYVDYKKITRENLFDEDNQHLLFPVVR